MDNTYEEIFVELDGDCSIADEGHGIYLNRDAPLSTVQGHGHVFVRNKELWFDWDSEVEPTRHGEADLVVDSSHWHPSVDEDMRLDVYFDW